MLHTVGNKNRCTLGTLAAHIATATHVSNHVQCAMLQLSPRGDRVLVKVAEEEKQTRGGILLPVNSVKKPTSGIAPCLYPSFVEVEGHRLLIHDIKSACL